MINNLDIISLTEETKVTVVADEVTYQDMPLCYKRPEKLTINNYGPIGQDGAAVSCASTVDFEFNYDIDEASFEEAFSITPAVEGYFVYSNSFHKVNIQ